MIARMFRQIRPLAGVELRAIVCGSLGHLFAVYAVMLGTLGAARWYQGRDFWLPVAAAVVCGLLAGPCAYGEQLNNHELAFRLLRDIRTQVFDTMRRLAPAKLKERGRGNLVTMLTEDIELLELFYAHTLSPIAIAAVCGVANSVVFAVIDPRLGLTAFVAYLLVGLALPFAFSDVTFRTAFQERERQGRLHTDLLESLDGRRELIALGAGRNTRERLLADTNAMTAARRRTRAVTGFNSLVTDALTLLCIIAFAGVVWALIGAGDLNDPAVALAALGGLLVSFPPLIAVSRLGSGIQPTFAAARRVFALMDETPAVREHEGDEGVKLGGFAGISVRDVSFHYPDSRENVLRGLDLEIRPGDVIGVQGENGAGKSTLIDILMRFRDATGGKVLIGDEPIEDVNTASLRATETLVSQDTFIFSDTLAGNIAIARPDATREEIADAAHAACLDEVIDQFPDGLDHMLLRNGSELSDGQKQRVAVARAFLSRAPFMLFDEPTSNMDALTEGQVMRALIDQQHGRAYLIVSHRPAVLAHASRVLTMERGRLV
ncbi:ABC transporter, permease/ATP binding protein [Bifidobacterium avesanii]|nr:ABC transporter, permease/ATP binding protein [Bifidobacterium avesanii]